MSYAIVTPAGTLFRIVNSDLPAGKTAAGLGVLEVDATIAAGYRQDFSQGSETARGWQIVDGVARPILAAIPGPTVESLSSRLAQRRWEEETGGVDFASINVATDDRSKLMLLGAADQARRDSGFTTRWKTDAGWIELNATQLVAAADAVRAHVQACFAREAELADQLQVEGADLTALQSAIEQFWP